MLFLAQIGFERRFYLKELSKKLDQLDEYAKYRRKSNIFFSEIVAVIADKLKAGEIIKLY